MKIKRTDCNALVSLTLKIADEFVQNHGDLALNQFLRTRERKKSVAQMAGPEI
jgi:hypothetical protein